MRDILDDAVAWLGSGRAIAVATVVAVRGSAPRELGASMIVAEDGGDVSVRGNVSGGCVEGAVIEACLDALATGRASVASYGIAEDDLLGVGLMCGGSIDVLVRPVRPGSTEAADLARLRDPQVPLVLTLAVRGDGLGGMSVGGVSVGAVSVGGPGDPGIPPDAAALAGGDRARLLGYDGDGCLTESSAVTQYLVVPFGGPPRLVIVGAVQYGVALSRIGAASGYAVTVVDPRDAFTDAQRFPDAEVVRDWPDRWLARVTLDDRTAVCVLSHDEKIDVPALRVALASAAGYVGAMGSRRTHDDRLDRLRAAGVTSAQLARLRSPIGLDLGGRSPEETALSILAEIVAVRHGRSAVPLTEASGPLHAAGS